MQTKLLLQKVYQIAVVFVSSIEEIVWIVEDFPNIQFVLRIFKFTSWKVSADIIEMIEGMSAVFLDDFLDFLQLNPKY